jgi:hypothetical protein
MARSFWGWMARGPLASPPRRRQFLLELLEARDLPSTLHPEYVLLPQGGGATPFGTSGPTGYTPAQIRHAYGFDQISFNNGTIPGDGSGTTIAIVDAYDDPNIANDLHQFNLRFGLPDSPFTKVNQSGGSTPPAANAGWASEIALDVEWAHAIAPKASILLVEASSNSYGNLFTAVRYAAQYPGVVAVSMSWGGSELSSETSYDSNFLTPSGHGGVTFLASSGDSGAPDSYPSASPNVVSVGGTTLNLDSAGNFLSETAWSGSGGGISSFEGQPSYQQGVVTQTSTRRANPDVAYDSNPNTGFPVYDSYNNGTVTPWSQFGGTSAAAPQWAALIAIADQGRALAGLGSLDSRSETLPKLYALPASDFHDITSGTSTGTPNYSAGPGYDLVTGRGSPYANRVVADLIGQPATAAPHFSVSAPSSSTAGSAFTVTVTALDASGNTVPGYTGTVHFTSSDGQAVLPADYTFTSSDQGSHSFSVTLKSAGSRTVTVTDTANSATTGSATVTIAPAAASTLVFSQQPTNAAVGVAITPAVTVRVLDAYGNLVSGDNTDQVTVALGINPGGGTLGGTTTVIVSGGVATFGNLSINNAGSGYTLTATSGSLSGATSASFNITTSSGNVIEDFETSDSWFIVGATSPTAFRSTAAAHDGAWGLDDYGGNDWIYRNDAGSQVKAGDTVSVWLKFATAANGRAYFAFGATASGTLSLVAAPNTGQLILQQNLNYNFTDLAAVSQSYLANHWYRLEVDWGTRGTIIGKLFDSNGTTLLRQVTASTTVITAGGIGFRATGSDKYWDTVTATSGVNNFAVPVSPSYALPGSLASAALGNFGGGQIRELTQVSSPWDSGRSSQIIVSAPAGTLPGQAAVDHYFNLLASRFVSRTASPLHGADVWSELFWMLEGLS